MPRRPRVLVTRAAHQASPLAEALRARGAEPVLAPTIEIAPLEDDAALTAALEHLLAFDWLVFTSANAVAFFAHRLQASHAAQRATLPRIAAIGAATTRALSEHGFAADLVPPQAVAESLASALVPFARRESGEASRFLLIRAQQARDVVPETLRSGGAEVTIAPAYRTVIPAESLQSIAELLRVEANWPDAVTFTSSSSVRNLLDLLDAAGIALPQGILRASIGPVTSQTLREAGYPRHVESREATVESLAEAVMTAMCG